MKMMLKQKQECKADSSVRYSAPEVTKEGAKKLLNVSDRSRLDSMNCGLNNIATEQCKDLWRYIK